MNRNLGKHHVSFFPNSLGNGGNEGERVSEQEYKADHASSLCLSRLLSQQLPHRSWKIVSLSISSVNTADLEKRGVEYNQKNEMCFAWQLYRLSHEEVVFISKSTL